MFSACLHGDKWSENGRGTMDHPTNAAGSAPSVSAPRAGVVHQPGTGAVIDLADGTVGGAHPQPDPRVLAAPPAGKGRTRITGTEQVAVHRRTSITGHRPCSLPCRRSFRCCSAEPTGHRRCARRGSLLTALRPAG